jgi:CubicO group peptidase (beta-lactamase class C family)
VIAQPTAASQFTTAKESSIMLLLNNVKRYLPDASIVVGIITPNGTQVYRYGNLSKANSRIVNGNTIFDIASITKVFTTTLLADMVKQGLVKLDDPIEKYLPATVKIPTYNRHKEGSNASFIQWPYYCNESLILEKRLPYIFSQICKFSEVI